MGVGVGRARDGDDDVRRAQWVGKSKGGFLAVAAGQNLLVPQGGAGRVFVVARASEGQSRTLPSCTSPPRRRAPSPPAGDDEPSANPGMDEKESYLPKTTTLEARVTTWYHIKVKAQ